MSDLKNISDAREQLRLAKQELAELGDWDQDINEDEDEYLKRDNAWLLTTQFQKSAVATAWRYLLKAEDALGREYIRELHSRTTKPGTP